MIIEKQRELHQRMKSGDETAVTELYNGFIGMIHSIARDVCYDDRELEDVVSEGTLGFMECLRRWDPNISSLTTYGWLYIWGYCINYTKRSTHIVTNEESIKEYEDEHGYVSNTFESDVANSDLLDKVFENINDLDKTILIMHYYQEMTCDEIGAAVGKTGTNIGTRIYQAKKKLRQLLADEI